MSVSNHHRPPLAAHFIWHFNDHEIIFPVIEAFRRYLTRDIDRPFSREINIPTFLYSANHPNQVPLHIPGKLAQKDVLFLFTSKHTLTTPSWQDYIVELDAEHDDYFIVPVAIDRNGCNHSCEKPLKNLNFIRAFEWQDEHRLKRAILALSHELYRYGLGEITANAKGIDSSIKLFLSHAKKGDTGLTHAQAIKSYIDNSNLRHFFDANTISAGFRFDKEIEDHIKDSTMIAIISDAYSSRYWCQREILTAKQEKRPIVVANSLADYEDRIFPAAANVPCVHITADPLQIDDILRILIAALLETIRFGYAQKLLEFYQQCGWIDKDAIILSRPPEIQQTIDLIKNKPETEQTSQPLCICYPEPPLYAEETIWTQQLGIEVATPLWHSSESQMDNSQSPVLRIGLSISDDQFNGYVSWHQHPDELQRLAQTLARHLLARRHTLIYGGDLRDDGFTEFILEEAAVLRDRLQVEQLHVENHLAWPLYVTDASTNFAAKYYKLLNIVKCPIPADIAKEISDTDKFLPPIDATNKYIWSRCLTTMRENSIASCNVRVFAGGKLQGYKGKMPGLLEEFVIARKLGKPIYLIGGLGGLTHKLCQSILNHKIDAAFSKDWQITHNAGYQELQQLAAIYAQQADYQYIAEIITNTTVANLAQNTGLTIEEYTQLMQTPFVEQSVHLILKGIKRMSLC